MMPATLAIIINVFEEKERPKAIAIWAMMAGVGVALGPILGGALLKYFYWGSVFLVNVPIAAIAITASLFLVPDSRDPESRPLDIPGALLSMGAVSALILAIIEGPDWGATSPQLAITVAAAVIFGLGFVLRERQAAYPLLDFALFRLPRFSTGAAAVSLAFFSITGFIFGFTQYLQFVQGLSPLAAGIRFLPIAGGFIGRVRDVCDLRRQARGRCGIAARRGISTSTRFNLGGGPAGGIAAARGRARPNHRCELGIHGCAGAGGADRSGVLARRDRYSGQVHAGARH